MAPAGEMWSVVTESPTMTRQRAPAMSLDGLRLAAHAVEVRRAADVRRCRIPLVEVAGRDVERAPALVARVHVRVRLLEHLAPQRRADHVLHLRRGGPDVREIHVLAVRAGAERLVDEVEVHAACKRVRDDERR